MTWFLLENTPENMTVYVCVCVYIWEHTSATKRKAFTQTSLTLFDSEGALLYVSPVHETVKKTFKERP